ncbi:MAG TPA: arylsulfatase [Bacillales bacterium]|nr:arylsulfatase [Bacillales bacterium]
MAGFFYYGRFKHETRTMESFEYVDDYLNWLRDKAGAHSDMIDLGLDCNASTVARPWHLSEDLHPTNWVTTQSIDFLRRRDPTKPFFLKMSFVRPHPPFDPPEAFYNMYINEDLPEPPVGDWADHEDPDRSGLNPVTAKGKVPERRRKRAQAAYYALITHIDHQIGRFMNAMQEYGVYDNTVILFVSDHGELLGDHNLYRKILPYEGSAKVPFILADPGNHLGIKKNHFVDQVVELRDIMPTLLDAADLEIPKTVEGKSVLSLCSETGSTEEWRDFIHGEHAYGDASFHYVTNGKQKYIWYSQTGEEQLFDLERDPQETVNLAGKPEFEDKVKFWRDKLIKELGGREEGYSDGEKLIVGKQPQTSLQHLKNH